MCNDTGCRPSRDLQAEAMSQSRRHNAKAMNGQRRKKAPQRSSTPALFRKGKPSVHSRLEILLAMWILVVIWRDCSGLPDSAGGKVWKRKWNKTVVSSVQMMGTARWIRTSSHVFINWHFLPRLRSQKHQDLANNAEARRYLYVSWLHFATKDYGHIFIPLHPTWDKGDFSIGLECLLPSFKRRLQSERGFENKRVGP